MFSPLPNIELARNALRVLVAMLRRQDNATQTSTPARGLRMIATPAQGGGPTGWTLRFFIIAAVSLLFATATHAEDMIPANAVITSRIGSTTARDASGQSLTVTNREGILPSETTWGTEKNGKIFLSFSNGIALGIDSETSLRCLEYRQRPFREGKEGFEYEPSVSSLQLQLNSGQIVLSASRLSPRSHLIVQLPFGHLKIHKGTCLIRHDSMGLHLGAINGNLTYYYPDGDSREFVTAGNLVRISEQSATRQQPAQNGSIEQLDAETRQLMSATDEAGQRVLFKANEGTSQPPRAVMIVRPDYFEQPSLRPYEFLD